MFEFFLLIQDHLVLDRVELLNPYYYLIDLKLFDYLLLFSKEIKLYIQQFDLIIHMKEGQGHIQMDRELIVFSY